MAHDATRPAFSTRRAIDLGYHALASPFGDFADSAGGHNGEIGNAYRGSP